MTARRALALGSAAILLGACVASSGTPPPREPLMLGSERMQRCVTTQDPSWCGSVTVPEDPAHPDGRRIDLKVVVIPARSTSPRPDAVFMLAGGPGGAATESYRNADTTFPDLHRDRDIVLVDQRGTGGSNRLAVAPAPDVTGLPTADADAALRAWLSAALAELPGDPRFYTTAVAMDDLDRVRAALGYERIDLYGASYGATAAQYYMKQHPDRVRSVVLDGATLIDVPIFERVAANGQRALDLMLARCDTTPWCRSAYPDLRGELASVLDALAQRPVTTTVPHPWTAAPIIFDRDAFAATVHEALKIPGGSGTVPVLIHAAYLGSWDRVARTLAAALGPKSADTSDLVMSVVIRCSEAWARFDPDEVARSGAGSFELEGQLAGARSWAASCRYVPGGVVRADDAQPVRSNVPTLLVLGEADPQDPPANIADAPNELPASRTVVVPGQGHTVGHLGCVPALMATFFERASADGLDASCATNMAPPAFIVNAP